MLRKNRHRWDMSFADSGAAALSTLAQSAFDVIVTDYRMPGMDGAELLERVRVDHPGTARVILSGQTNEDNVLKIILLAHEFINKPSTSEQIVTTVERLIAARGLATDEHAQRDVAAIESLPSAPSALAGLIEAVNADDASAKSVAAVIETDPATTAKVLHLVNSSAYTSGRKVSNVAQAIALLGMPTVRGLVLLHDLVRTFDLAESLPPEWISTMTAHSVESSRLARRLAAGAEWESHAFTAGLLHEVGQLVLASSRPAAFGAVTAVWRGGGGQTGPTLAAAETAAFDVCHHDVGARLLDLWGLPAIVIEAVAGHGRGNPPVTAVDPASAVALAHLVVEASLGPICGPCHDGTPSLDEDELDENARNAIARWRHELSRH
jgi:HD-like signal output (HDOD) protein